MAPSFPSLSTLGSSYKRSHAPPAPADTFTTSFLLGNLHCPTCVFNIKAVLRAACRDHIQWVSPNIVTSVVTVEHDSAASIATMAAELKQAGFEVCGVTSTFGESEDVVEQYDSSNSPDTRRSDGKGKTVINQPSSTLSGRILHTFRSSPTDHSAQSDAHLRNCQECRKQKEAESTASVTPATAPDALATVTAGSPSSLSTTPPSVPTLKGQEGSASTSAPIMSAKSLVTVDTEERPKWRANIAVGGMTCAACSNTITNELSKRSWIDKVAVNLITNSAAVDFFDEESKAADIAEAIEDLGYDATIDSVVNLAEQDGVERDQQLQERTVEIAVEGMYCEHCPGRVVRSLAAFQQRQYQLRVDREPTRQKPILKVTYVPQAPVFTVRQILAAVEAGDQSFSAEIHHPPTLEERSKQIQHKHQLQILWRVIFTGVVCIPTFVLGIVYMSLIPEGNRDKHHLMLPWTSGISRLQMALFVMATPVYFCAADVFHVRAFKEIWTLWRPGSRTPFLQRFYRFGSMNTLMSLGTTIAYVSSTSQLVAAAVHRPKEVSDSNFYFDAVVFLTFFLLVGRLIESYSKAKTGNAVEALGKLRPTTAILVERPAGVGNAVKKGDSGEAALEDKVVKTDLLDFGDVVRVPHGNSPPADGVVVQGQSSFDESSLTGESKPIKKGVGDQVFAGTVNKDGPLLVRITGVSGHSMLDQIVRIVREGQTKRAPLEQFADVLTTYFVPCVTLVAIATWAVWLSLGFTGVIQDHFLDVTSGGWVAFSLQFAIAVFVVACPCGIALAAPTAIFVGGGLAARHGILAKGGGLAFETASRTDCVVFDKTGTLTVGGEPKITDSRFFVGDGGQEDSGESEDRTRTTLLAALKAVEENSSHTIAKAIVSFCTAHSPHSGGRVEDLQEIPGKGMRAIFSPAVDGGPGADGGDGGGAFEIIIGNKALMEEFGAAVPDGLGETLGEWTAAAKSVALAATRPAVSGSPPLTKVENGGASPENISPPSPNDRQYTVTAALAISDPIRPEAVAVIAALKDRGVGVYMLSGDNVATARAVGSMLGIEAEHVLAEVLPAQKAEKIKYLQSTLKAGGESEGRKRRNKNKMTGRRAIVAMVGDGVNDAPALTQADVGVAVGSGSDVAISSAGFVLVKSDLRNVVTLLELSKAVFRRIKFNFGWALVYNLVALPVAAGVFYPIVTPRGQHIRLDPVWAALAMALSSISVVLSSLALRSRWWVVGFRASAVAVDNAGGGDGRPGSQGEDLTGVVVSSEVEEVKI